MLFQKLFMPKSFNSGFLPEKDGHKVYFAEFGNPKGQVVVQTHGCPGFGCNPFNAKMFDLKKYRVVFFDQRGCGKSEPLAKFDNATTQDTLDDMYRLLQHLKISEKVILRGGSWSSALSLLFAIKHPDLVEKMVLNSIFLARKSDIDWGLNGSYKFYPDMWSETYKTLPKGKEFFAYYVDLINSSSKNKQKKAIKNYLGYEQNLGSLHPKLQEPKDVSPLLLGAARAYVNLSANNFYLQDDEILKNTKKISHIPTLIVHNRMDFVCPLNQAYELHQKLPNSNLVIVPDYGHGSLLMRQVIRKEMKNFL